MREGTWPVLAPAICATHSRELSTWQRSNILLNESDPCGETGMGLVSLVLREVGVCLWVFGYEPPVYHLSLCSLI